MQKLHDRAAFAGSGTAPARGGRPAWPTACSKCAAMQHDKARPGATTRVDARHDQAAQLRPGKRTLLDGASAAGAGGRQPGRLQLADVASAAGTKADSWAVLFQGQPNHAVQKAGRIQAERGVKLRERPEVRAPHATIAAFGTQVVIQRESNQPTETDRWCFVTTAGGAAGFCERQYVATDMPECTAKLHLVKKGETLGAIAERAYGANFEGGNDVRLYVHALYIANKGRVGIQLTDVDLSAMDTQLRGKSEEETLRVYRGVRVLHGMALWIPSAQFVEQLKSKGEITSGSTVVSKAWRDAKDAVADAIDNVVETAGLVVGLVEGAGEAVYDMVSGAVEMVAAVAKLVFKLITGDVGGIVGMARNWIKDLSDSWGNRGKIADGFLAKWNADDPFQRGRFRGEVIGWVAATIFMIVVTAGQATAGLVAIIATKFPNLVKALKTVGTLGDATKWAGDAAHGVKKLGGRADELIRKKIGEAEAKKRERERDRDDEGDNDNNRDRDRGASDKVIEVLDKIKRANKVLNIMIQKQGIARASYTLVKPTAEFLKNAGERAEDEDLDAWVLQKDDSHGAHREVVVLPRAMRKLETQAREHTDDGNRDVRATAKAVLRLTNGQRDRLGVSADLSGASFSIMLLTIRGGRP